MKERLVVGARYLFGKEPAKCQREPTHLFSFVCVVAETKASVVPEKPATRARGMPELPTTSEFSGQIIWVDAQGVFWLRPDSKVTIH